MTEQVRKNGVIQIAPLVIAGLIFVLNGFALFWLSDVKSDVRELRQNYVDAIVQVTELKAEVKILNQRIEVLNNKITELELELKQKRGDR